MSLVSDWQIRYQKWSQDRARRHSMIAGRGRVGTRRHGPRVPSPITPQRYSAAVVLGSARTLAFTDRNDLRTTRSNDLTSPMAEQRQKPASLHHRDLDAQGHDEQLDRNRGVECPTRHDRGELLTHEDGNR